MRIAVAGLHTECSTYNPVRMHAPDFRQLRGGALLAHPEFAPLAAFDVEWLPILHARAVPGGPIARATYDAFKAEFLAGLRAALPIDGLYLAMHGASFVDGMTDAEGDWITAARAVVGPDIPIAASYDLHGNVSQRIIDALDIFAAYRTAPHIDVDETKSRAVAMLLRTLRTGARPTLAWTKIPMLLPGERTSTNVDPGRALYAALPAFDATPGIWDANLMVGYVWADEPRATACAVVTGTDRAAMQDAAGRIAHAYWNARHDFAFGQDTADLDTQLAKALAGPHPAILADSADNPTGGGVGDRADILAALIARGITGAAVIGIADPPATAAAFAAGPGATPTLTIGGSLDPSSRSITAPARILHLADGPPPDRQALVEIAGIRVALTARRRPFHSFADFAALGLDPRHERLLVVKSGYLSPDLSAIAAQDLMVLSHGVVNQNIPTLPNHHRPPSWPWVPGLAWGDG
jgi:microcystin degradation protein MlrC